MKKLLLILVIAAGAYHHLTQSGDKPTSPLAALSKAIAPEPPKVEQEEQASVAPKRQVHISGKWYDYRADNTYQVDGVPTLFIPKRKGDLREAPVETKTVESDKSQKLMETAQENPLHVYTPEGFKTLQEGLEAAKAGGARRNEQLEAASKQR